MSNIQIENNCIFIDTCCRITQNVSISTQHCVLGYESHGVFNVSHASTSNMTSYLINSKGNWIKNIEMNSLLCECETKVDNKLTNIIISYPVRDYNESSA